ncbi:hypothetical protein DPMN_033063 [Dreissena polymorpha]|uniref:Uncharacterized protein n=1 Tax=Dreissena polymorpha TaxID=45954 RepID=A0A9D4M5Y6_DREPO|nr:hypothetical protein DPMN_033063 [Dreissena polymorpha]
MRTNATLVLLLAAACVHTVPLKNKEHCELEDALNENKAQSLVGRSEASGLKTLRLVDPVGTSVIQSPAIKSSCGKSSYNTFTLISALHKGAGYMWGSIISEH